MSNIAWLEITFENLDWVRIPGKYLLNVEFDKLPAPLDLEDPMLDLLDIDTFPVTGKIFMLLSRDILSKNARYKRDWPDSVWKGLISRLKQNDITFVDVSYDDGSREHHNVAWKDAPDNEYANQSQKVWIDCSGNIAISISAENGNNETDLIKPLCAERLQAIYPKGVPECAAERLAYELALLNTRSRARPLLLYHKLSEAAAKSGGAVKVLGSINGLLTLFLLGNSHCNPLPAHYYCDECGYSEFPKTGLFGIDLPDKMCPGCGKPMRRDGYNLDVFSTRITEEGYVPAMEYRISSNFLDAARRITVEYAQSSGRTVLPLISGVEQSRPTRHVGYIILPDGKAPDDFKGYIDCKNNGEMFVRYGEQGRYLSKQCGAEQILLYQSTRLSASVDKTRSLIRITEMSIEDVLHSSIFAGEEYDMIKSTAPMSFGKLCDLMTLSKCSFEDSNGRLIRGKKVLWQDFYRRMPIYSSNDIFEYLTERGFDNQAAHEITEHIRMGRGLRDLDTLYRLNAPDEVIELSKHCRYLWSRASMAEKIANMLVECRED